MEFFPSMQVFLKIGSSIEIRMYAIVMLVAAIVGYYLAIKEIKKAGYDPEVMDDLFIGILLAGLVGARLYYCCFTPNQGYFSEFDNLFKVWDGGLSIQGAVIGGLVFAYFYCRNKKYSFLYLTDMLMPYLLFAQAIGVWGTYFNQQGYGKVVTEGYFDEYLAFLRDGMFIDGYYREPIFIYECLGCLLGWFIIGVYRNSKKKQVNRGDGIFCYLSWYGLVRFWIEILKAEPLVLNGYKVALIVSVIFMVVGLGGLLGGFMKKTMNKKPVIVFDLDGTLLDTEKAIVETFVYILGKYVPELVLSDEDKASFLGPTLQESFIKYAPGFDPDELVAEYRKYNIEAQKKYIKPFPNVPELLAWLKENDYKIAIGSSKTSSMVRYGLELCGLSDYFEVIVGVDMVSNPKPHKETIVKAVEMLGGGIDNAVYVGDSAGDIICAKNAGVFSIAFTSNTLLVEKLKATEPNRIISDMIEVKDIVSETGHGFTYNEI